MVIQLALYDRLLGASFSVAVLYKRVCLLGVNNSEASEIDLVVKCLLGADDVLHRRIRLL